MFKCRSCKSIDKYELIFNPQYEGKREFTQEIDKNGELIFHVDGYSFKPDLAFMNSHAVCRYCGNIYMWDYE